LHAGTKQQGDMLVTSGGRVLGVTSFAPTLEAALSSGYAAASKIHFEGMHYRTDIGGEGRARSARD
jgi:phosphoribosylamine--glycine ligase